MHFGLTLELVRGFEVTTSSCPHSAELTTSVCKLYSLIMEYELIVSRSKQSEHETCMTRVTTRSRVSCSGSKLQLGGCAYPYTRADASITAER